MRILSFQKKWSKLYREGEFTTYRFTRKDRLLKVGEVVQIVYKTRSQDREVIGQAKIIRIEEYHFNPTKCSYGFRYPTDAEAQADGFQTIEDMLEWFFKTYGQRIFTESINKITLEYV
jgi:hypothetical protein